MQGWMTQCAWRNGAPPGSEPMGRRSSYRQDSPPAASRARPVAEQQLQLAVVHAEQLAQLLQDHQQELRLLRQRQEWQKQKLTHDFELTRHQLRLKDHLDSLSDAYDIPTDIDGNIFHMHRLHPFACFMAGVGDFHYSFEFDNLPMMLVAHSILLRYNPAAVMRTFVRFLSRCCRLDLAHMGQFLHYLPRDGPFNFNAAQEVQELPQDDILAAFAAYRPELESPLQRLRQDQRDTVLAEVASLAAGTSQWPAAMPDEPDWFLTDQEQTGADG